MQQAWITSINSARAEAYGQMLHIPLGLMFGVQDLRLVLHRWIDEGLMAIFFFGVGHATLASVPTALFVPARVKPQPRTPSSAT